MKSNLNFKAIGMFVMLFVLVVSASSVQTVSAQRSAITATSEAKPELQVKFLGSVGEFLFFELAMQQNDETRSNLRIRNESGTELYTETVFQKTTVRKLKIAKGEADKIEFLYNTTKGEVRKLVEIKIKVQEAVEVTDITKL